MSDTNEKDWGILNEFFEDYVPPQSEPTEEPEPVNIPKPSELAKPKYEDDDEYNAWVAKAKEKREKAFLTIKEMSEILFKEKSHIKLSDYLTVQSHFPDYSVNNCLLIAAQRPEATVLKSFDGWKNCEERIRIKKGTSGITILEPGDEYLKQDGSVGRYYNTRTLFDISQVQGVDYENPVDDTSMNEKLAILFGVTKSMRINIFSHTDETRAVLFHPKDFRMYINKSADRSTVYNQLAIELAHSVLSDRNNYTRPRYGFICQMVGYLICIATNEGRCAADIFDCFDVPPAYENLKKAEVIKILEVVRKTANTILFAYRKEAQKYKAQKSERK